MTAAQPADAAVLHCPHCKKTFTAELLGSPSDARRGFKCPHCRLFVPSERAEDNA